MGNSEPAPSKYRRLKGFPRLLEVAILSSLTFTGALWAVDLAGFLELAILREQYLGLFWAQILSAVFLLVPASRRAARDRVPWYDWIAVALSLTVGLNVMFFYPTLLYTSAIATPDKVLLGVASLVLLIEGTRRQVGTALLVILLFFLTYGATAEYWPGLLNGSAATLPRLAIYLYLDTNALLGVPMGVAATIVLSFILLGQALFATGGGAFFTNLAMASMGRFRGGPAKIAVVASTLFGTISGTAVSNVVTTGIITIPMMRNNGYRKETAAAVEAVASTGGQIMPPVMGAAAFLMAEFLEISYGEVVLAALVPALLYYFLLFIQVDLEAAKHGLAGLPADQLPKAGPVMWEGWKFLLPLAVLIYVLFWLNFPPGKAGLTAVGAVMVVALFPRLSRSRAVAEAGGLMGWVLGGLAAFVTKAFWILVDTGRALLEIGIITGIAGIIIGVLNLSGLGFSVSFAMEQIGGNSLIILLLLTAVLCIVLGMGMPTASVYILLAVLIAPALEKLGLEPIAAHLFIFYFGLLSMITPPVAIASYAAAALAGSDPMRTAWSSVKLGAMAYIVPFIFIFSQELLLRGPILEILWSIASTALGAFLVGVGLAGYLFRSLRWLPRMVLMVCACALFFHHGFAGNMGYWLNAGGALVGLALIAAERNLARRRRSGVPAPGAETAD